MKFRTNNITAHFDMVSYYEGIPTGVDFKIEKVSDGYYLRACGYGCLEKHSTDCYGNGCLYIQKKSLSKYMAKKLKTEATDDLS